MSLSSEIKELQDEIREGYVPEKKAAPDHGEPWIYTTFRNCIRDRHNVLREIEDDLRDRARECVNACAGMADPSAEIQAMREEIKEAHEALKADQENQEAEDCGRLGRDANGLKCAALTKLQLFIKP